MPVESNGLSVFKKYISRKIKSIAWRPFSDECNKTKIFIAGSWDDTENLLSVWKCYEKKGDCTLMSEYIFKEDLSVIKFVTPELFVIGTGSGDISLFHCEETLTIKKKVEWKTCHKLASVPAHVTSLAIHANQIASVGEDGKLVILQSDSPDPILAIDCGGGCSIDAVSYLKASEVITASMQGHLKLWDLRSPQHCKMTILSPDQISITDLANHPSQHHLVAAGGEDGGILLWDMRHISQPLSMLLAHTSAGNQHQNVWFSSDVAKGAIDTSSLIPKSALPINCIDIIESSLIAGSDNESIYIVNSVIL